MKNKYLKWIFIAVAVIILAVAIWYFTKPKVEDPNANNTPVPPDSPTPKWVPENFPLNVGMFGAKIKALQKILGIADDGKFGQQTKGAIEAAGYSVPLSESDYNKLMQAKDTQNPIGKTAYAAHNAVNVYKVSDNSVYKTANKDEWIGVISGEYNSSYWLVASGIYKVYKQSVYFK